jgi:hypothetical protein
MKLVRRINKNTLTEVSATGKKNFSYCLKFVRIRMYVYSRLTIMYLLFLLFGFQLEKHFLH